MHKFFLNLTIALLLPAAILSSNTNHYDKEWFLVDSLIEKQEQIKAIDAVHAILDKAKADDNDYEILRCALMLNRLDAPNSKNAGYSSIRHSVWPGASAQRITSILYPIAASISLSYDPN